MFHCERANRICCVALVMKLVFRSELESYAMNLSRGIYILTDVCTQDKNSFQIDSPIFSFLDEVIDKVAQRKEKNLVRIDN